jgi:L-amino acid N-acyltransferase YncA
MTFSIRQAGTIDLPAITEIYNQGFEDGVSTLETDLNDVEARGAWLLSRNPNHKVMVIIDAEEGTVYGWASLNVYSPRMCFDGVADISIYIRRDLRGQGLGKRLLDALSEEARSVGFHKLVLTAPNSDGAGKKLYHFIGFREVGVYLKHILRNGNWVDVVIMEKILY